MNHRKCKKKDHLLIKLKQYNIYVIYIYLQNSQLDLCNVLKQQPRTRDTKTWVSSIGSNKITTF